jgi:hypothetical protein
LKIHNQKRKKAMSDEKKGFWKKIVEIGQTVGAGAGIIALQHALEESLARLGKKAGEHAAKKTSEWIGLDTDGADKNVEDEIYYEAGLHGGLIESEIDEINAFEARLRKEDSEKAKAFVLFIAKIIKKFEREETKTDKPQKGQAGPTVQQKGMNIAEGVAQTILFLKDLLRQRGDTPNETYQKRVDFLEGKNVFSLIPKVKPAPGVEAAKKHFQWGKGKIAQAAKTERENRQDFNETAANWRERARAWRNSR